MRDRQPPAPPSPDATTEGPAALAALVAAITGVQALASLAVLALATLAPDAAADFGLAPHLIGYQVSLIYAAAALGSLVAGALVQRHGAGSMSLLAMLLASAGVAATVPGHVALAGLGALLIGAGYALTNPSASVLLHRHAPPAHRNVIFSIKQTGVPLGGVLAGVLLPVLAVWLGWQGALAVGAALILAAALPLLGRRRIWDRGRQPGAGGLGAVREGIRLVLREPGLRALSLAAFCLAAMQLSLMTFTVTLLVADLGWGLIAAGATLSAVQMAGAAGRLGWGRLADLTRRGDLVLVGIGVLTASAALAMPLLGPQTGVVPVLALLLVLAAGAIGWNGVFMAEIARQSPPESIGLTTGTVLFVTFTGVVVGPALFTALYAVLGGYGITFAAMAVFPMIGAALLGRAARRG